MASGLVFVGMIAEVRPIEGADRIEAVTAVCGPGGKWSGVAQKGTMPPGELCMVFVQDALLPSDNPDFSFMERYNYIVRMRRFKGVPSEALIMPLPADLRSLDIGTDITDAQRVTKYEKEYPYTVSGSMAGDFPHYLPKTDEPNFQRVGYLVDKLRGKPYYVTEKADGSSATVFWLDGALHICSRNRELWFDERNKGNAIYEIAKQYNLEEVLKETDFVLQFETVGPGIQKNPMGLKRVQPLLFQIYRMSMRYYVDMYLLMLWSQENNFPMVTIVDRGDSFNYTDEDLRQLAEGLYPNGHQREGIVVRPTTDSYFGQERVSFKSLNLLYGE